MSLGTDCRENHYSDLSQEVVRYTHAKSELYQMRYQVLCNTVHSMIHHYCGIKNISARYCVDVLR